MLPYGGFYNRDEMSMRAYDVRNSLSYNKVFDNGVRTQELNVLGGVQAKFADRHFNSNSGYGYQYDYGGVVAIDPKLFEMLIARQFPYYSMTQTYDRQAAGCLRGTWEPAGTSLTRSSWRMPRRWT